MSTTSAETTRQQGARRERFEARHDTVRRIHDRLSRLDALVEDLRIRVPRARIEADLVAHLGPGELDVLRSALDDETFADPDRARLALAKALRERDALLELGRRVGGAVHGPPACREAPALETRVRVKVREEPAPPFAAQAHGASAGTSLHPARSPRT